LLNDHALGAWSFIDFVAAHIQAQAVFHRLQRLSTEKGDFLDLSGWIFCQLCSFSWGKTGILIWSGMWFYAKIRWFFTYPGADKSAG
jgi:hypothetical protein